jgi:hypothetical protein
MTTKQVSNWEDKRTAESRMVEDKLHEAGLERVDAYRYNSASLRVRVIDKRFESIPREERDSIVEPFIDQLPSSTQADIVTLVLLAPSELEQPSETFREFMLNTEFENPSPSML